MIQNTDMEIDSFGDVNILPDKPPGSIVLGFFDARVELDTIIKYTGDTNPWPHTPAVVCFIGVFKINTG